MGLLWFIGCWHARVRPQNSVAVSQKIKPVQTGFQQCLSINLGSPTSRPQTGPSYQIGSGLRLEIKCTVNVLTLNHPKTTIPQAPSICGKTVFHETISWCHKGRGPPLSRSHRATSTHGAAGCAANFLDSIFHCISKAIFKVYSLCLAFLSFIWFILMKHLKLKDTERVIIMEL